MVAAVEEGVVEGEVVAAAVCEAAEGAEVVAAEVVAAEAWDSVLDLVFHLHRPRIRCSLALRFDSFSGSMGEP